MGNKSTWNVADIPDLTGRVAVVTGANSGLGLATAHGLAGAGARVLMACRNQAKAEAARNEVAASASGPAPEVVALDLSDLGSVADCAAGLVDREERIDILVNNAGVMALPLRRTAQGFEMQFGTNHLGHFALTGRVLPLLLAAPAARVVNVASNGHKIGKIRIDDLNWNTGRYSKWLAYGQTKLADLLFTTELDRRAKAAGSNLVAASAHPGYASTNLSAGGPLMSGSRIKEGFFGLGDRLLGQSAEMGALPQLYAATMPDVVGDEYFGPDGVAEMRGHPVRTDRSKRAQDKAMATRLWEASEELTGVTYDWG